MKYILRKLNEEDKFTLSVLRRNVLSQALPPVENNSTYNWGPSDRAGLVLGIFQGPQLISTLRHESIDQTELFEHRLEVSFSHLPTRLPISLTCRAATLPEYRGLGLYSVLKMVGLISSLELGHEFSFSLIRKSSFQVEFFKNLGYEFFESNFNKWQSSHPAGSPFCIAKIDLQKKGDRAVHYLAKKNNDLIGQIITLVHSDANAFATDLL